MSTLDMTDEVSATNETVEDRAVLQPSGRDARVPRMDLR